jgi:hypothetical protein
MSARWTIASLPSGEWQVCFDERPFGSLKRDAQAAIGYLERCRARHGDSAVLLYEIRNHRVVPRALVLANGERLNVPDAVRSKREARRYMLRRLGRGRLPRNSHWEVA